MRGIKASVLAIAGGVMLLGASASQGQVGGCTAIQQTYTGCERPSWSLGGEPGGPSGLPGLGVQPRPEGMPGLRFEPGSGLYQPPREPVIQPSLPPTRGAREILNRQNPAQAVTPIVPMAPLAPILPHPGGF
ncbi:hypothetical protein [Nitrospira sp. Kam-Ns4a]